MRSNLRTLLHEIKTVHQSIQGRFEGPLIGFSREKSWSIGKIPLEITIGDPRFTRKETLNFVIVKFDSPYNMLLLRIAMQKMEIVVSTIHGAIKFDTTRGIGTVFSTHESDKVREGMNKVRETPQQMKKGCSAVLRQKKKWSLITKISKTNSRYRKAATGTVQRKATRPPIQMAEGDEDKTTFFAGEGVSCYRNMPFGLKNARATYQRLVDKSFPIEGCRNITSLLQGTQSCTDKKNIQWTQEAEATLQEMKKFVEILLTLTATPVQGEILMMYLAASTESISATLFAKREEEQVPIYFQGGYEGRVAKWAIELGEHDIVFQERGDKTPKDFLIEVPLEDNEKKAEEKADTKSMKMELSSEWKLFTDGAASFDGSDAGLMLIDPEGKEYTYALRFIFETTNNEVEYEALLVGLRISQEMEITSLSIFVDSQLLTDDIVKEVHEGSCGFNAEPRSMVVRITKQGYYSPSMHRDAAKVLQDCEKCKEQSAIRKVAESSAITAGSGWPFRHWGVNILGPMPIAPGDLCKGLKLTQSFFPIMEHIEIMNHIEKQLARSKQGWVNDLAQVLWVHRTPPRNSQKETLFSLTYGSKAIIPIPENDVGKDDRGRIKEVEKIRGNKEIASIEEAYY
ncbi:reverse transcriptase domain-containing protein [Tanacetum coccineum]